MASASDDRPGAGKAAREASIIAQNLLGRLLPPSSLNVPAWWNRPMLEAMPLRKPLPLVWFSGTRRGPARVEGKALSPKPSLPETGPAASPAFSSRKLSLLQRLLMHLPDGEEKFAKFIAILQATGELPRGTGAPEKTTGAAPSRLRPIGTSSQSMLRFERGRPGVDSVGETGVRRSASPHAGSDKSTPAFPSVQRLYDLPLFRESASSKSAGRHRVGEDERDSQVKPFGVDQRPLSMPDRTALGPRKLEQEASRLPEAAEILRRPETSKRAPQPVEHERSQTRDRGITAPLDPTVRSSPPTFAGPDTTTSSRGFAGGMNLMNLSPMAASRLRGPLQALEMAARQSRIHVGHEADAIARRVQADAVTMGTDIFFRSGRFAPERPAGFALLSHELTHVSQHLKGEIPHYGAASEFSGRLEREAGLMERTAWTEPSLYLTPASRAHDASSTLRQSEPRPSDHGGMQTALVSSLRSAEPSHSTPLLAAESRESSAPPGAATPDASEIAAQVFRLLERKIQVDKERLGIRRR